MVQTTPYHLNLARTDGKKGIFILGGMGSGHPLKNLGGGTTPYHLNISDRPVIKAW